MTGTKLVFMGLAVMLLGILAYGLRRGVMLFSMGWVYRDKEPFLYWLSATVFALGVVAMTIAASVA